MARSVCMRVHSVRKISDSASDASLRAGTLDQVTENATFQALRKRRLIRASAAIRTLLHKSMSESARSGSGPSFETRGFQFKRRRYEEALCSGDGCFDFLGSCLGTSRE